MFKCLFQLVDLGYWANPLFPQSCCEFLSGDPAEQFCVPSTTPTQWMHPIGCFKAFTFHLQEVSTQFITYAYWMSGYQIFCFLLSIYLIYEVYSYRKNERDFQIYCSNFVEKSKINSAFLKTCSQESNESQETVVESTGSSERSSEARSAQVSSSYQYQNVFILSLFTIFQNFRRCISIIFKIFKFFDLELSAVSYYLLVMHHESSLMT